MPRERTASFEQNMKMLQGSLDASTFDKIIRTMPKGEKRGAERTREDTAEAFVNLLRSSVPVPTLSTLALTLQEYGLASHYGDTRQTMRYAFRAAYPDVVRVVSSAADYIMQNARDFGHTQEAAKEFVAKFAEIVNPATTDVTALQNPAVLVKPSTLEKVVAYVTGDAGLAAEVRRRLAQDITPVHRAE